MEPSLPSGNVFFMIGDPPVRLRFFAVVLLDEAMDGCLTLGDGVEDRMLQTVLGQLREKTLTAG